MRTFNLSMIGKPDRSFAFTFFSSIISSSSSDFFPASEALKIVNQFYLTCTSDIVWGKFSDGSAETPEEGFNDHSKVDVQHGNSRGACEFRASFEVMEGPARGKTLRYIVALIGCHSYLGDVGTKI